MTVAMVAKLKGTVVAVADGRLSRGGAGVTFDTAKKMEVLCPTYKYPKATIGAVEQTSSYHLHDWCLMYAGTHVLASEVRDEFRRRITSLLVDRTNAGTVDFVAQFSGAHKGNREFHIDRTELPKIPSRLVVEELKRAYMLKGNEWWQRRSEPIDVEFILFGADEETKSYKAFIVRLDVAHTRKGQSIAVEVAPVPDMSIAAIGVPAVSASIMQDQDLLDAIENSVTSSAPPGTLDAILEEMEPSKTKEIMNRMLLLAKNAGDPSVGGNLLVALGASSFRIEFEEK